jgi:hypothetical protein
MCVINTYLCMVRLLNNGPSYFKKFATISGSNQVDIKFLAEINSDKIKSHMLSLGLTMF